MVEDAMARIRLADGREVWRRVYVRYREVGSGRWVSAGEVEKLILHTSETSTFFGHQSSRKKDQIRQQIVEAQSRIALDEKGGAKSTGAARLVLKTLDDMNKAHQESGVDMPWFILGQQLAIQVLQLIQEEQERK